MTTTDTNRLGNGLTAKIAVYIPTSPPTGKESASDAITATLASFARLFGGSTLEAESEGSYIHQNGTLEIEPIRRVYAYTTPNELLDALDTILQIAENLRDSLAQESIAVEIDDTLYLIY